MTAIHSHLVKLLTCLLLLALSSCASWREPIETRDKGDPWEPLNRKVLAFNIKTDKYVLKPITVVYLRVVPPPIRTFTNNFIRHINTPYTLVHDLLQGELERANVSFGRFVINTTVGFGGLLDPASELGYSFHSEDFGQTLAVWGAPRGAYLVLPFLGPSTTLDAIGLGLDAGANRLGTAADAIARLGDLDEFVDIAVADFNIINVALGGATALNARAQVHELLETLYSSDDAYSLLKTGYLQNRAKEVANGRAFETEEERDIFEQEF